MQKSLCAEFTAKVGHEEHVAGMLASYAAQVRQEPGNVLFLPYTLESHPRRFFVFEIYESEAAFETHIAAEYGAPFNAELAQHIEEEASALTLLRALAPSRTPAASTGEAL